MNVACGKLDWGYQVQGSHNNNKAGKQEEKGKKDIQSMVKQDNKSKHRCCFFIKVAALAICFFSACCGCMFDGYLISRLDTVSK